MTFNEMIYEAELLYESINSSAAPGFTETEWSTLFTAAQRKVVTRILNEGLTNGSFNISSIEYLVRTFFVTFSSSASTDSYFKNTDGSEAVYIDIGDVEGLSDVFWILDEYVTVGSEVVKVKRITFDFYLANLKNPFKKPDKDSVFWSIQYNNRIIIITDGSTISSYHAVGVVHPDVYPIGSESPKGDCVLNVSLHSLIVEEAVRLARLSVLDNVGYQMALTENSLSR